MSIIALNGYAGSGKDLVGKMIQYYTSPSSNQRSDRYRTFDQFIKAGGGSQLRNYDHHYYTDWEIKKFAGKLKEITCMLTGVSMSDLEDQKFKAGHLDPMWDRIYINQYNKLTQETLFLGPYTNMVEAQERLTT